jgi:hypothetical protein
VIAHNAGKRRPIGVGNFLKVLAGAKGFSFAGNYHTAHLFIAVAIVKALVHFGGHGFIKTVKNLWPAKLYSGNALIDFKIYEINRGVNFGANLRRVFNV